MSDAGMRRADRAVTDPAAITAIIRAASLAHVGFVADGEPYVVPLNYGWEPGVAGAPARFWFHSATAGRGGWTYADAMLDRTLVWCVEVARLTAKEHRSKEPVA